MKREDLEKLGLTVESLEKAGLEKDVVDKIMTLHGNDLNAQKSKVETAESSVTEIQKQLDEANKQIEGFKNLKPEDLQKAADDWKAKAEQFQQEAEQAKKDAESKIESIQFGIDFDAHLKEKYNIKDIEMKAVKANLNMDTIKRGDETVKFLTLDEQMKPLLESHPHYANSETPNPKIITKSNGGGGSAMSALEAAVWKGSGLKPPTNE